jgi:hypothetical protein
VFNAAEDADLDELRARLLEIHGISITLRAQHPGPLPEVLRRWIETHSASDLRASLTRLAELIE